jgi:hypothetical protein
MLDNNRCEGKTRNARHKVAVYRDVDKRATERSLEAQGDPSPLRLAPVSFPSTSKRRIDVASVRHGERPRVILDPDSFHKEWDGSESFVTQFDDLIVGLAHTRNRLPLDGDKLALVGQK